MMYIVKKREVTKWLKFILAGNILFMIIGYFYAGILDKGWWEYKNLIMFPVFIWGIFGISVLNLIINGIRNHNVWRNCIKVLTVVETFITAFSFLFLKYGCKGRGYYTPRAMKLIIVLFVFFLLCSIKVWSLINESDIFYNRKDEE